MSKLWTGADISHGCGGMTSKTRSGAAVSEGFGEMAAAAPRATTEGLRVDSEMMHVAGARASTLSGLRCALPAREAIPLYL